MNAAKTFRGAVSLLLALVASAIAQEKRATVIQDNKLPETPAPVVERYQKNQAATRHRGETGLNQITIRPDEDSSKPSVSDRAFVEQLKGGASPVITGRWVTFVYRGDARDLELAGEMTNWGKSGLKLIALEGTKIKYLSMQFPLDARIEYKYIADDKWQLDPLNPNKKDNGIGGENNFFTMREYQPSKDVRVREGVKRGRIEPLNVPAEVGRPERAIRVYLPPGYDASNERLPTLYFGDGIDYIDRARAAVIADNLIADGRMRPVIMVFVAPLDRSKEYWMSDAYVEWLVKRLVPAVDSNYRTIASGRSRAIAGASLGGLISAYAAYLHPELFGNVIGQSSAFQVNGNRMISDYSAQERKAIRWYLEVGRYEGLIDSNRRMKEVLQSKGYELAYKEVNAGHNWTHWSDALADALSYTFPAAEKR